MLIPLLINDKEEEEEYKDLIFDRKKGVWGKDIVFLISKMLDF